MFINKLCFSIYIKKMDVGGLFVGTKWDILSRISSAGKHGISPILISKELGTTLANVVQQVKLFDYLNVVDKTTNRTVNGLSLDVRNLERKNSVQGNLQKGKESVNGSVGSITNTTKKGPGKPGSLYSLSNDFSYVVSCMNLKSNKTLLKVNSYQKYMLSVWQFFEEEGASNELLNDYEKFGFFLKDKFELGVTCVYSDDDLNNVKLVFNSRDAFKKMDKKIETFSKKLKNLKIKVSIDNDKKISSLNFELMENFVNEKNVFYMNVV